MFMSHLLSELYTHTKLSSTSYFSFIGACLLTQCRITPQWSFTLSCFLLSGIIDNFSFLGVLLFYLSLQLLSSSFFCWSLFLSLTLLLVFLLLDIFFMFFYILDISTCFLQLDCILLYLLSLLFLFFLLFLLFYTSTICLYLMLYYIVCCKALSIYLELVLFHYVLSIPNYWFYLFYQLVYLIWYFAPCRNFC